MTEHDTIGRLLETSVGDVNYYELSADANRLPLVMQEDEST